MPIITPPSRAQLAGVAEYLEVLAAKLRAADPNELHTVDVSHDTTFEDNPFEPASRVTGEDLTIRIEWMPGHRR